LFSKTCYDTTLRSILDEYHQRRSGCYRTVFANIKRLILYFQNHLALCPRAQESHLVWIPPHKRTVDDTEGPTGGIEGILFSSPRTLQSSSFLNKPVLSRSIHAETHRNDYFVMFGTKLENRTYFWFLFVDFCRLPTSPRPFPISLDLPGKAAKPADQALHHRPPRPVRRLRRPRKRQPPESARWIAGSPGYVNARPEVEAGKILVLEFCANIQYVPLVFFKRDLIFAQTG